jgi:endoglycosylceramidase
VRGALVGIAAGALAACAGDDGRLPEARRCAIEAPAPGGLAVAGTRIVDDAGRTVTLRGINAGGRSKFAPYAPFDFDDYDAALAEYLDRAATWGIDVLRVPFSWNAAEPAPGVWDEAYLARYDALLDGAWARGLWTIVDFHQDVYAEPLCGDGFPSWTLPDPGPPRRDCPDWFRRYDEADVRAAFNAFWSDADGVQTAFKAMWTRMVDRHRDRPGVIGYEPINEPHPGSASPSGWAREVLTPFYSELAALIVERDPDALVFVGGTGLEGVLGSTSLARPAGDSIVFAPHSYDPGALFGFGVDPDVEPRLAGWAAVGRAWDVPVLIGEMGIVVTHPEAAIHLRRHLDAMDALGLHGTWWEYSQAVELWNFEDLSVVDADGRESAMVDELARPYPRALAGEVVEMAYDAAARRFALTYAPAGGAPSEVAVPPRWGAVRVGAEGACVDERTGRLLVAADPDAPQVRIEVTPR